MIVQVTTDNIEVAQELLDRDFPGLDLGLFLSNKMNRCLVKGGSGALFAWRGPNTYETHVFFSDRGREALATGHELMAWMRLHCDARTFWSAIPIESRKVAMFARLMGWKYEQTSELPEGPAQIFSSE